MVNYNYDVLPKLVSEVRILIENLRDNSDISGFPFPEVFCNETPTRYDDTKRYINKLEREFFYLWEFVSQNGDQDEAREYLEEHIDYETPFEWK